MAAVGARAARSFAIASLFLAILGHSGQAQEWQCGQTAAVNPPSPEEMKTSLIVNQIAIIHLIRDISNTLQGMAEKVARRDEEAAARDEEAAARDERLQETLKGMASLEQELLTKVTSLEQELVTKVTSLEQGLVTKVTSLEQELLTKVTSLEQELVTKVTSQGVAAQQAALRQEMTSEVNALREEIAALGRLLEKVHEQTTCPDGWLHHESSCYLVDDTRRTWDNSLEYCKGRGGDLAKITSAEEQEFIKAHWGTYNHYWIGLIDKASEGRFVWTDGTLPTYTRWREGQPDGGGVEDCVYMYRNHDDKWYDGPCSSTLGAVCERPVHA